MSKKLVLFDIDGTLTVGGIGHAKQENQAIKDVCGKEVDVREFNIQGKTEKAIFTEVLQSLGYNEKQIKELVPEILKEEIRIFLEQADKEVRNACPGVKKLLQQLQGMDCRLGLVTGNQSEIAFAKLRQGGIADFFSLGGFGDKVLERYRLVEIALMEAKKKFNEGYKGKQIVIIGDSKRDIDSGKPFGAKTIAVLTGVESAEEIKPTKPDYVFKDLTDTEKVLEAIFND